MRLLPISNTHGKLGIMSELTDHVRVDAVVHAGDFGSYDAGSHGRLSDCALRLQVMHSDLSRSDKELVGDTIDLGGLGEEWSIPFGERQNHLKESCIPRKQSTPEGPIATSIEEGEALLIETARKGVQRVFRQAPEHCDPRCTYHLSLLAQHVHRQMENS